MKVFEGKPGALDAISEKFLPQAQNPSHDVNQKNGCYRHYTEVLGNVFYISREPRRRGI